MATKKKKAKKKTKKKSKAKKKKVIKQKTNREEAKGIEPTSCNIIYADGKQPHGKSGRPSVGIDLDKVKELAKIGCTQSEIYAVLRISKVTFITMKKNNPILMETILAGREEGNASLRRKQMQVAMQGNPQLLIWLGKNKLKQVDKSIQHLEISKGETFKQALASEDDGESNEDDLDNLFEAE